MTSDGGTNPWFDLELPTKHSSMNLRRVDWQYPWDFFWAKDIHGAAILLLKHDAESAPGQNLPKLSGLEIEAVSPNGSEESLLLFRLIDQDHVELFHSLCLDIMEACRDAHSLAGAVDIAVRRTWRWHDLLRGGRSKKLSPTEQQGLIAELLVLHNRLFACYSKRDSLEAWTGPTGSPRDFEAGRIGIEAKARRGSSKSYIEISSADQLDTAGADRVFLSVTELDRSANEDGDAFTLVELISEIQNTLTSEMLVDEVDLFAARLAAAGFDWSHDYSDDSWVEGKTHLYEVCSGFPRLEASRLPAGIDRVRYVLQLSACEPFKVDERVLLQALTINKGTAI